MKSITAAMPMPIGEIRLRALGLTALCFVVVLCVLTTLLTPATELTRFRNSLLSRAGQPEDFNWVPGQEPDGFRIETLAAPEQFVRNTRDVRESVDNGLVAMEALVKHLRSRPKQKGPIKSTTERTYTEIITSGRGYCADYTQVFNGLAHSIRLPVREWGLSFDGYGGDGHAFNEIYNRALGHWSFVDPMNGFYVEDRKSGKVLSVLEFRDRLLDPDGFESVRVVAIGNTFLFESEKEAFDYYSRGGDQFFLWFGNDVFTYDAHPVIGKLAHFSRSAEQLFAITIGIHPELRIVPTTSNEDEINSLLRFKYQIIALALAALLLGVALFVQLIALLRIRLEKVPNIDKY